MEIFLGKVKRLNVPILAGIIPLKSAGMARFLNKNVSGDCMPEELINRMATTEDKIKTGIEIAANLVRQLKSMCRGVQIVPIGWEKKMPDILRCRRTYLK